MSEELLAQHLAELERAVADLERRFNEREETTPELVAQLRRLNDNLERLIRKDKS